MFPDIKKVKIFRHSRGTDWNNKRASSSETLIYPYESWSYWLRSRDTHTPYCPYVFLFLSLLVKCMCCTVSGAAYIHIYIWFHLTWVFQHGLLSIPPECLILNPEAQTQSPIVGLQLIHQRCQSASSLCRPRASSLRPQGTGISVWNTQQDRWDPLRASQAELVRAIMVLEMCIKTLLSQTC